MPANQHPINTTGKILLAGGAVLTYALFSKASAAGSLNFYPAGIKDLKFTGGRPVLRIGVKVQNTSNQSFTLKSMAGNIYEGSTMVGNMSLFKAVEVPDNSQVTIWLDAELFLIGVVQEILDILQGNANNSVLDFEGTANIDRLRVPVWLEYPIGK